MKKIKFLLVASALFTGASEVFGKEGPCNSPPVPAPGQTVTWTTVVATVSAGALPAAFGRFIGIVPCLSPTPTPFSPMFSENFDGVAPPALPAGWTATNAQGPGPLWGTSNSGNPAPPASSLPNSAFIDDPPIVSDKRLDSPPIVIPQTGGTLTFANNYHFNATHDGGVLEISINGGPF